MSKIISEVLKFTIKPETFELDSLIFAKLRSKVVELAGVKEQYYGLAMDTPDKLLWIIHWPGNIDPTKVDEIFREDVKTLDINSNPSSWLLPFESADIVRPGLTAPITDVGYLHLNPTSTKEMVADSLHKAYTDCIGIEGYKGGYWTSALNDEKMNMYHLGWESRELQRKYANSDLFSVEINKLKPHIDFGHADFVGFKRHEE